MSMVAMFSPNPYEMSIGISKEDLHTFLVPTNIQFGFVDIFIISNNISAIFRTCSYLYFQIEGDF
jgi:hypothetical protein